MSERTKKIIPEPFLEAPPALESPITQHVGTLFAEDSLALAAGKLNVLEAFLKLLTRDYKFNDFTRELLLAIMRVVKSEAGSLLEVDQRNNTLFFRSVVGTSSDRITEFVIPMGQGIVGYVAESRQHLVVTNVKENQIHLKAIQNAVGFEARNLIALPIIIRGRVFGVLELLNRIGEENFTSEDIELLTYLCDIASKAIEIRLMLSWSKNSLSSERSTDGEGEAA